MATSLIKAGFELFDKMQGLARTIHFESGDYTALSHRSPVLLRSGQKASPRTTCF
jgi:hypothetical protein